MRLIDADMLITGLPENDPLRLVIEKTPTAYDKEQVFVAIKILISPFLDEVGQKIIDAIEKIINNGLCGGGGK